MKRLTAIVMTMIMFLCSLGVTPVLAAETTTLDGMSYTVESGADGSIIMRPTNHTEKFPQYNKVTDTLEQKTVVVIFDKVSQHGLEKYQECFYFDYTSTNPADPYDFQMQNWVPNGSKLPGYDTLKMHGIHQNVVWKYYPNQGAVSESQITTKQFLDQYGEPNMGRMYVANDGVTFGGFSVGDWILGSVILPDYGQNLQLMSFDLEAFVGIHEEDGHGTEELMSDYALSLIKHEFQNVLPKDEAAWLAEHPFNSLNDWDKYRASHILYPGDRQVGDFGSVHYTYGADTSKDKDYHPKWTYPGDVGRTTEARYEFAWFMNVPNFRYYYAAMLTNYKTWEYKPGMEESYGLPLDERITVKPIIPLDQMPGVYVIGGDNTQ